MISMYSSSDDHPTSPAMPVAHNVETVVELENTWKRVLTIAEELQSLGDKTQNVSLLAALHAAESALCYASTALNKASIIIRRDGL